MRHLKTYESFDSYLSKYPEVSTHIQTIEDILLDLKDDGCYTHVVPTPIAMAKGIEPDIHVLIEMYEVVPETFLPTCKRMVSYMDSVGWGRVLQKDGRPKKLEYEYSHKEEMYIYKMNIRFFRK